MYIIAYIREKTRSIEDNIEIIKSTIECNNIQLDAVDLINDACDDIESELNHCECMLSSEDDE